MHINLNAATGEIQELELTDSDQQVLAEFKETFEQKQIEKQQSATKRAAAEAKLVALGLDLDDLTALGL